MIRSRKGQIKMFESIAVIIIFFFLLSFGFTFYGKIQKSSNEAKVQAAKELDAVSLAIKASSLSELQCSVKNIAEPNCYDLYKVVAFRQMMQSPSPEVNDHYFQALGYSTIKFHVIYPESGNETFELYSRPLSSDNAPRYMNHIPMVLYDPIEKVSKFGYLEVSYYLS